MIINNIVLLHRVLLLLHTINSIITICFFRNYTANFRFYVTTMFNNDYIYPYNVLIIYSKNKFIIL
jgi:hypothetical protein